MLFSPFTFFLLSISIFPTLSTSNLSPNIHKYLLSQLLEPYEHHLSSFLTYNSDLLDSVQSLLSLNLPNEPKESLLPTHHPQKNIKEDYENNHEETGRKLLEAKDWLHCYNGGIPTDFKQNKTICTNAANCVTQETSEPVCVCPYDSYGIHCQIPNKFRCKIQSLTFPEEECEINSEKSRNITKYYSYSIDGDKPCHSVKQNAQKDIHYKLDCHYDRPDLLYEGIKNPNGQVYPAIDREEYRFVYDLDYGNIKLTSYHKTKFKMTFIDWKFKSRSPEYQVVLEPEHFSGEKDVILNVDFDKEKMKNVTIGGRYYYEISLHGHGVGIDGIRGVLEDADFVEPRVKNRGRNKYRVPGFFGGLALLVMIVYVCRQKLVKYQKNVVNKGVYKYLDEDISTTEEYFVDNNHHNKIKVN